MKKLLKTILTVMLLAVVCPKAEAVERKKLNFNSEWRLCVGDYPEAVEPYFDDSRWQQVTLPSVRTS